MWCDLGWEEHQCSTEENSIGAFRKFVRSTLLSQREGMQMHTDAITVKRGACARVFLFQKNEIRILIFLLKLDKPTEFY